MQLVVGVDSSTTACKVHVREAETGDIVATGRADHPPTTPPRSEQQPRDWESAFVAACSQAEVPRPAKLWNDTESAPDAAQLVADLPGGDAAWAAACGSVPVPSFTITKLKWLQRCEPDVLRRTASVLLPHDWLTFRLTGRRTTDRGDASGTGYWSPGEERYRYDLLALVDSGMDWPSL